MPPPWLVSWGYCGRGGPSKGDKGVRLGYLRCSPVVSCRMLSNTYGNWYLHTLGNNNYHMYGITFYKTHQGHISNNPASPLIPLPGPPPPTTPLCSPNKVGAHVLFLGKYSNWGCLQHPLNYILLPHIPYSLPTLP